jgi:asparagine synthase (glutamine-hydrolysing)
MCGIAGVFSNNSTLGEDVIHNLGDYLSHRGPDGTGNFSNKTIQLVHKRLSIIDLENGKQPLQNNKCMQLIANGEVYNYLELRDDLGVENFRTNSDCEPPLLLYENDGIDYTKHLRGMFAIAIAEPNDNKICLSRDPFGIKPLYYTLLPNGVAFASEVSCLVKAGLASREINKNSRQELLQLQFTLGADTIFSDVKRVNPGETIEFKDGLITQKSQLSFLSETGPNEWDETEALNKLNQVLIDSVSMHQRSDVPYGLFLSGGVDSSVVLACMRELNDNPVRAFSAGFSSKVVSDEREHAKYVAKAAGADFNSVEFSENDFWNLTPEVVARMDDPTADYAILPTYKLAHAASKSGLKVVLSGEGGDELFAGYGRYRRHMRSALLGGRKMWSTGIFNKLDILHDPTEQWKLKFNRVWEKENKPGRTKLQVAQAVDCADWLPNDLLLKLDRCLMAHSVEGRTPLLDSKVASIAMGLSDNYKIKRGLGKYILRQWLKQKLPEAMPFNRKRGFTVPVSEWMGNHGSRLGELVASQCCIKEIASPIQVKKLFSSLEGSANKRNGKAAWVLLFYALWCRRHIEGEATNGTIFDVLSTKKLY